MTETTSSTSQARFVLSGERIDASKVTAANKQGPWECPSRDCRLPLTHVWGTQASSASATPTKRAPHFKRKTQKSLHASECAVHLNDLEKMAAYTPRTGYAPRNETVLLRVGHRQKIKKGSATASSPMPKNTGPDYAGKPGSMAAILDFMESVGGDDGMSKLWHTHNGVRYRWREIAYGADHSEYLRLHEAVADLVSFDEYRPWIIWGTVQEGPKDTKYDPSRKVIRVGATYSAPIPKVRVYFPSTPEFTKTLSNIVEGKEVAFVLSGVKETDIAHGVFGHLSNPSDLVLLDSINLG